MERAPRVQVMIEDERTCSCIANFLTAQNGGGTTFRTLHAQALALQQRVYLLGYRLVGDQLANVSSRHSM